MNLAHTDDTQLDVFADFDPKLSDAAAAADVLFLGNIQPDLQRKVRGVCSARLRRARLDEHVDRDDARLAQLRDRRGRLRVLNDAEIRMLTGQANLARAARAVMEIGPKVVVAKQGEYGAALFTEDGFFALPAMPLEDVRDPTGAGDSFAGGFLGYLDSPGPAKDAPSTPASCAGRWPTAP